jgi:dimethylaniline monooxygenase (N-oxide forming)
MRLNTSVTAVRRDDAKMKWVVDTEEDGPKLFDKVVLATGINQVPIWPTIEGIERFEGTVTHSRSFKKYELAFSRLKKFQARSPGLTKRFIFQT